MRTITDQTQRNWQHVPRLMTGNNKSDLHPDKFWSIGVARIFSAGVHFSLPKIWWPFLVITFFCMVISVTYATNISSAGVHLAKFTPFLPHFNKNCLEKILSRRPGGAPVPPALPPWLRLCNHVSFCCQCHCYKHSTQSPTEACNCGPVTVELTRCALAFKSCTYTGLGSNPVPVS